MSANTGQLRRVGEALSMIARGKGDHAAFALIGGQLQDGVERPARLECASSLQILGLEPEPRLRQPTERRGLENRCPVDVGSDAFGRRQNVVQRDIGRRHLLVGKARLPCGGGDAQCPGSLLQHNPSSLVRPTQARNHQPVEFTRKGQDVTQEYRQQY
jgi:hypothetical protein